MIFRTRISSLNIFLIQYTQIKPNIIPSKVPPKQRVVNKLAISNALADPPLTIAYEI